MSDPPYPIHQSLEPLKERRRGPGICAIRGDCGKKGIFGQTLPCPDDGDAEPVRLHPPFLPRFYANCHPTHRQTMMSAPCSPKSVDPASRSRKRHAAPRRKSTPSVPPSPKPNRSWRPAPPAGTTFEHTTAPLPVPRINRRSSTSSRHSRRTPPKRSRRSTITSRRKRHRRFIPRVRMFSLERRMGSQWI